MKIGIVTQPLNGNFGGIMQNFALQKLLSRLGHQPVTFDFISTVPFFRFLLTTVKSSLLIMLGKRRNFIKRVKNRPDISSKFIDKYINKTKTIHKYQKSLIKENHIECLIVGSDQVWRPSYNKYLSDMYLKFASSFSIPKIAYGISFGVDENEYNQKEILELLPLVKKFKAISTREHSGISIIKNNFNFDAVKVLDPTMLLNKEDYYNLIVNHPHKKIKLGAYILDETEQKNQVIKTVLEELNMSDYKKIGNAPDNVSVETWLSIFRDAEYIVTDSYHGAVFSIIFNKQFLVISNIERGAARFISLLEPFGLLDRLVNSDIKPDTAKSILLKNIRWDNVNHQISIFKDTSINFLKSALENNQA